MSILWHLETDSFRIRKLCIGGYENNAYVVACNATGAAVIVDAAAEPDAIVAATEGLSPQAVLTTHGHFDHVAAAQEVSATLGIPFLLHPADEPLAQMSADGPVGEGPIEVGELEIIAVHTPGHTLGSTCLILPGVALTGDTLFPGGPGATVSPGSSFEQIIASIDEHLMTLPDETLVLPGHGLDTTIGAERPALPEWIRRGW